MAAGFIELLEHCQRRKIRLWEEEGRLRCSAPPGVIDGNLLEQLKLHKEQLIRTLANATSRNTVCDDVFSGRTSSAEHPLSPNHERYAADHGWDGARTWSTITLQAPYPFSFELFSKAVFDVCMRNDCLRTAFPLTGSKRVQLLLGRPILKVERACYDSLVTGSLSAVREKVSEDLAAVIWDFENGHLGKLVFLEDTAGRQHFFAFAMNRIVMDGPSARIFLQELVERSQQLQSGSLLCGDAQPLAWERKFPDYLDYTRWIRKKEATADLAIEKSYWRQELASPLPDPFGMNALARVRKISAAGAMARSSLDAESVAGLQSMASRQGFLYPIFLFGIFAVALWVNDAGEDLVSDTSLLGRTRPEFNSIMGFFSNAAAIRINIQPELAFADVVAQITRKYLKAEELQSLQYDKIVDVLNIDRITTLFPLTGILFNNLKMEIGPDQSLSGDVRWAPTLTEARYGLSFYAMSYEDGMGLELKHRVDLIPRELAVKIVADFRAVARYLLKPGRSPMLSDIAGYLNAAVAD